MTPTPTPSGETLAPGEGLAEDTELEGDRSRMTFLEHLDELRRRIIYSLYALAATCGVTFFFIDTLYRYLLAYFNQFGAKLIYTQMTEAFMLEMKIALLGGIVLASPFIFSQVWLFVAPGLYAREKKVVLPFVFFSTVLFGTGVWFSHVYAFPSMFRFFSSFQNEYVQFFGTIREVFSFYVKMILAFGIVFQMPILVFFLARFGIITARFMWKQFKYAVLIIFIIAAIVTPSSDPVNQTIFAAPMIVLYLVSIVVAWMFGKKRKPATIGG